MKFNLAVCGGTFDHFHKGHKEFLRHCLSISKKILIGITTDNYVKSKNKDKRIQNYKLRKQNVERFLQNEKALDRCLIEPIDDIFIPKEWENLPVEAVVVTKDTILGAEKINLRRIEQEKAPLKIEVFPLVQNSYNEYISSSNIRGGKIDIKGLPYINPIWLNKKLFITDNLRRIFKKPFGDLLIKDNYFIPPHCPNLITVGDITTKNFNSLGLNQDVSVIDFKVARKRMFSNLFDLGFSGKEKIIKIENPSGCLTPALFNAASLAFELRKKNDRVIIEIEGEEDLSVLPLVLAAPLGSVIFYGQPDEGVVKINISEKNKKITYGLVSQFREDNYH
jgi:GTP-dependent dephospho-CoA kinase